MTPIRLRSPSQKNFDIVGVVGKYIELKKIGDKYIGICPFHLESTPSFVVYPTTNSYHCFGAGCGATGTASTFLKRLGLQGGEPSPKIILKPKVIKYLNPQIVKYWHSLLKDRSYFYSRGFTDELIDNELWGWMPQYKRYSIPVWQDVPGNSNIVGMRFRASQEDQSLKYFGLSEYNYPALYNRHKIGPVTFIVFGEFDAKALEMMGYNAVSPTAGVNGFLKEWTPLFNLCKELWVVPDNTDTELGVACDIVSWFPQAKLGKWPQDVKDANEFYLKYKKMDKFFELQQMVKQNRLEWAPKFSAVST